MVDKICKGCGTKFVAKHNRQSYCKRTLVRVCPVCLNEFEYICGPEIPKTCCSDCASKLRYTHDKVKKICDCCGKEFTPNHPLEKYCQGPHFKTCAVCGNEFEYDVRSQKNIQTCSQECHDKLIIQNTDIPSRTEAQRKSIIEKYGVDNSAKILTSSEKSKQTQIERYGKLYTQTDKYKDKVRETCLSKYNVEHHLKSSDVRRKIVETNISLYGQNNPAKSKEVKSEIKKTVQLKYG